MSDGPRPADSYSRGAISRAGRLDAARPHHQPVGEDIRDQRKHERQDDGPPLVNDAPEQFGIHCPFSGAGAFFGT